MRYFPIFLDLDRKAIFIAGGGAAAANKLRLFAKTNATIRCVAPAFCEEMKSVFASGRASFECSDPVQAEFGNVALVIAATESEADEILARRADAAGILVNAVDKTELCTFITPSIVDRGRVVVAIGTEGSAPVLARRLREQIEILLPDKLGLLSQLIGENREQVSEIWPETPGRRTFWESIVDGEIGQLALQGRMQEAQTALDHMLREQTKHHATRPANIIISPLLPDDLTIGALRALQDADVLVFHKSVPDAILDRARRDAQRIMSIHDDEQTFIQDCVDHLKKVSGRVAIVASSNISATGVRSLKSALAVNGITVVILPQVQAWVS